MQIHLDESDINNSLKQHTPLSLVLLYYFVNPVNMVVKTFGCSLPEKLLEKLDIIRSDIPRSKFITRILERELSLK